MEVRDSRPSVGRQLLYSDGGSEEEDVVPEPRPRSRQAAVAKHAPKTERHSSTPAATSASGKGGSASRGVRQDVPDPREPSGKVRPRPISPEGMVPAGKDTTARRPVTSKVDKSSAQHEGPAPSTAAPLRRDAGPRSSRVVRSRSPSTEERAPKAAAGTSTPARVPVAAARGTGRRVRVV